MHVNTCSINDLSFFSGTKWPVFRFYNSLRNTYGLNWLGFRYMTFICYLKSYYAVCDCVKVFTYTQIVHGIQRSATLEPANNLPPLSFRENFSLCIGVFVQSPLCSCSFPYMEISNPVYIIAGIHQGMQFACLPGSVMQRRTACNCLSHHLQKKILKSNCTSDNLDAHGKEAGVGGWERSFSIHAAIYITPS